MTIATHYTLTNNTSASITLPHFQTISPGLSAALSIQDYLLYCQYDQEFLQQVDNGDITVQYYTGDPIIVPKPASAILRPEQELYVPCDGRRAFTAPVSGVPAVYENHLVTKSLVREVSGSQDVTYGKYRYEDAVEETGAGTTSPDWQTRTTLTLPATATPGYFRIGWFAEFYNSNNNKDVAVRLYNATDDIITAEINQQQLTGDNIFIFTGFKYVNITQETTWYMQWRCPSQPGTAYVGKVRIEIWSVRLG